MATAFDSVVVGGRTMERVGAGSRIGAPRRSTVLLGALLTSAFGLRAGLKDPAAVETAPAVPRLATPLPANPGSRPEVGPWLVDRARDFGLDVVTRHGEPDKPSVL